MPANGPEGLGLILGRVMLKTQKILLDALLNTALWSTDQG